MIAYHDTEWGVPVFDDRVLFEFLTLEGAQAGLSWLTVLRKREAYRAAFADFDVERVARFGPQRIERLMQDAGIVRNRLKLESTVKNARAFLKIQAEFGQLRSLPMALRRRRAAAKRSAREARRSGAHGAFGYAAVRTSRSADSASLARPSCTRTCKLVGMVNDHWLECFRAQKLAGKAARVARETVRVGALS